MDLVDLMRSMSVNEEEESAASNFHTFAATLNGHHTDIIYATFTSSTLLSVSQYEKIGCLLRVRIDEPTAEFDADLQEPIYTVELVFGADGDEQRAAARYLAATLAVRKTFMVFLCLRDYSPATVRRLGELLLNVPSKE